MAKTQLPYLIQEALAVGEWKLESLGKNNEKYVRHDASIEIGTMPLNGTTPPSYVFRMVLPEASLSKPERIDKLCKRIAKK